MLLLGIDLGSSSVKATLMDGESGKCLSAAHFPEEEMKIKAVRPGWAEQEPDDWWINLRAAVKKCVDRAGKAYGNIGAVGISYQMHGLVIVGKDLRPLRPSIIWCDSRAVEYGRSAFDGLGRDYCLGNLLNSPGNFTAAKLAWVKDNEPAIFSRIFKIMLPGDYIAMRMTGEISTTFSGLSEGIFWDFTSNRVSKELLSFFGFGEDLIPASHSSFTSSGSVSKTAAHELGIPAGIPVSYRAGDQPNNAFSLNVHEPGEVAATAGTSGVIYGVTGMKKFDPQSRVNTFLHVNHSPDRERLGVLLCINGTGILNSWLRKNTTGNLSYNDMNDLAATVSPGSDGICVFPFGNGSERMLSNQDPGAQITGLNFNIHKNAHLFRAAQEGIAFSFRYGLDIMKETGIDPELIRAGEANMFLSRVFRETLAGITGVSIHLYNTDGSAGAARGAGIGCGYYKSAKEAFGGLKSTDVTEPDTRLATYYNTAYNTWKEKLAVSLRDLNQ